MDPLFLCPKWNISPTSTVLHHVEMLEMSRILGNQSETSTEQKTLTAIFFQVVQFDQGTHHPHTHHMLHSTHLRAKYTNPKHTLSRSLSIELGRIV